jgi:hypothetical protein
METKPSHNNTQPTNTIAATTNTTNMEIVPL